MSRIVNGLWACFEMWLLAVGVYILWQAWEASVYYWQLIRSLWP